MQKSGLSPAIFVYVCRNIMLISISDVKLQRVIKIPSSKVFKSTLKGKIVKKLKLKKLGPRKLVMMYRYVPKACFM